MKKLLAVIILAACASVVFSLQILSTVEIEGRIGAYITTGPEEATSVIGNGFLAGGSMRYTVIPMFKVGISVDTIGMTESTLTSTTLPKGIKPYADLAADSFDVDYRLTPICAELVFVPWIIPAYANIGVGMYTNSVTVTERISGENREIYSKSESKFGGFIGAGVRFGVPHLPISLRAGARYHFLKGDDKVTDTINAVSLQLAIAVLL